MVRTLVLALVVLAAVAGPAHAGGHRHHGGGFHLDLGIGIVAPLYPVPYPYAPYPYPYYAYPVYGPPPVIVVQPAPPIYVAPPPPSVQREVVYPAGRFVLQGDGVYSPYQWVWIPNW
jgi:hypothetical protein